MKNIFLVIMILFISKINAQGFDKFINVTGTSELVVKADQMEIGINIKTIGTSIEDSKKINDRSVSELSEILKSGGIAISDIEISPLSLGKNYEYKQGERVQNGYFTNINVSFLLKDLSKYYKLIDKISTNDFFEITNSSYKISDYEIKMKSALEKALLAAKEKAFLMAQVLNVNLGSVLEIDETIFKDGPIPFNTMAKESFQEGGITGKVTITKSIRVKFAIM